MNYAVILGSVFFVHVLAMVSPGPSFLIVTQTAISRTRRSGILTALGVATGTAIWSSVAILGLGMLFTHLTWVYGGLKLFGGIYLIYLGVELWRKADQPVHPPINEDGATRSDWQAFRVGVVTNLLNPKAAVFFGSVFVALLTPDVPTWVKLAAIGMIVADSAGWHIALACFFSTEPAQQVYGRMKRWIDRIVGTSLALVGLRFMLASR